MAFSNQTIKLLALLHLSTSVLANREALSRVGSEECILNIVEKSTKSPALNFLRFNDQQYAASTPTQMVSSMTFSDGCASINDQVDISIPTDGIKRSFHYNEVKSYHDSSSDLQSNDKSLLRGGKRNSSPPSHFWWYGEDPTDGSTFEYTTDSNGEIIHASFVDMASHGAVEFFQDKKKESKATLSTTIQLKESASESRRRLADLVEGDTVICDNESSGKIYRWTENQLRHYPLGTIASSWTENWRDVIVGTDCSSLTIGEEMPIETMPTEELIRCLDGDITKVYQWMEGNLRHVPKGRIAALWKEGWRDAVIDLYCNALTIAQPMTGLFLQSLTRYHSGHLHFQADGTAAGDDKIVIVRGLESSPTGEPTISFHSLTNSTMYVRHMGFEIVLQDSTYNPTTFNSDASFIVKDPVGGGFKQDGFVSFESLNYPTYYLFADLNGMLKLLNTDSPEFSDDRASFRLTSFGEFYPPV